MGAMASQITGVIIICPTVGSGADKKKHLSSTSLAFVREIHRWPANSPYKGPVTQKMFQFDDVIMCQRIFNGIICYHVFSQVILSQLSMNTGFWIVLPNYFDPFTVNFSQMFMKYEG